MCYTVKDPAYCVVCFTVVSSGVSDITFASESFLKCYIHLSEAYFFISRNLQDAIRSYYDCHELDINMASIALIKDLMDEEGESQSSSCDSLSVSIVALASTPLSKCSNSTISTES